MNEVTRSHLLALLLTLKRREMLCRVVKRLAQGHTTCDRAGTRPRFFREFTHLQYASSEEDAFLQLSPQVNITV